MSDQASTETIPSDLFLPDENRFERLNRLMAESFDILSEALETYCNGKTIVSTCALYSGGNDSTTMTHLFKDYCDYAIHVNTGIGISQTRDFVKNTCDSWGLPLLIKHPPAGSTYRELVLDQGFPGPAMHYKMYQRLKERGLLQVRREFVKNPRSERIVFLAGRRRDESKRRENVPTMNKQGSIIWVSPMVNWTKFDLATYRIKYEVPQNSVSGLLHMSGECLCGAFAKPGELDEIDFWFPEMAAQIHELENDVRAAGHEEWKCKWGHGGRGEEPSKLGIMCGNCEVRFQTLEEAALGGEQG